MLSRRALIGLYLGAVLTIVTFVPWTDPQWHVLFYGYSLVFFPPENAAIDYGKVLLELIALTCIAGFVWLLQDRLENRKKTARQETDGNKDG